MTDHDRPHDGATAPRPLLSSVIVPTWNSSAIIPRALASIADPAVQIEILLVDDCSHDVAVLRRIAADDPRVTLIEKPARTNAAHSRAIGLEHARGDLVAFLDSDDCYRPGHLARRRLIHRAQDAGIVIGRFRLDDGLQEWDGPMRPYDGGDIEDYLFTGGDARTSTLSIDRSAWRGTTFDATLTKHQDWGFVLAAGRNAERIGFDPEPGVVIEIAGDTRMSSRANVEASLAFASDHLRSDANRRRFLLGRLRTSLRLGDTISAKRFRDALIRLRPNASERWSSAAMLAAGRLGIAAPLHRLMTSRR